MALNQQQIKARLKQPKNKNLHFHIPYGRIDEFIEIINELKVNLEIYFSAEELDRLSLKALEASKNRFSYTPSLSIHGPFMDLSPGAVDPMVRDVTMLRIKQTLDVAEALGAKTVVLHSGYEKWKYDHKVDVWLEQSVKTWEPMVEFAQMKGIRIGVENIFEDNPENLALLLERIDSEYFGLCFDTGHFNLFSTISLRRWLEITGTERIVELHLHDNDTTRDHHWAPGLGVFPFDELFQILGLPQRQDIVLTVEAHDMGHVQKSLEFFQRKFHQ
ncbi:MAG: sugar phosphate isomerase/epimerase [Nitrospirae bacterium]|nr:MAG: sugar phosphate isomerase/epimerase [Nitrospirota bacterium]